MSARIDDLRSPTKIHQELESLGQAPKRSLGQNFLFDQPLLQAFVSDLRLSGSDAVVEIGPGLGHFTSELAAKAGAVLAVEKDRGLADTLSDRLGSPASLSVLVGDALELTAQQILQHAMDREVVICGNLPYYCSSPILARLFEEWGGLWKRAGFLLQEELVDRMVARPGTKDFGRLSVLVQAFSEARKLRTARPHLFVPKPEVTSAWVILEPRRPDPGVTASDLSRLTSIAFGTRRKTLVNNLVREWDREVVTDWMRVLNIQPGLRAEDLPVDGFIALAAQVRKISP